MNYSCFEIDSKNNIQKQITMEQIKKDFSKYIKILYVHEYKQNREMKVSLLKGINLSKKQMNTLFKLLNTYGGSLTIELKEKNKFYTCVNPNIIEYIKKEIKSGNK